MLYSVGNDEVEICGEHELEEVDPASSVPEIQFAIFNLLLQAADQTGDIADELKIVSNQLKIVKTKVSSLEEENKQLKQNLMAATAASAVADDQAPHSPVAHKKTVRQANRSIANPRMKKRKKAKVQVMEEEDGDDNHDSDHGDGGGGDA